MNYKFDEIIDRKNHNSAKWDEMNINFKADDLLPMWIADMEFKVSPDIVKAMHEKLDQEIFGYSSRPKTYYESAINWSKNRYNLYIETDSIIHSPGVMTTISIILDTLAKDEDKILIQTPAYPGFIHCIENNNKTIVENRLIQREDKSWEIDFEDFEEKIKSENIKWFILCNPHNPVGRVWSREELKTMSDICVKYGVRIISDEIWRDLVFKNNKFTSISSLSEEVKQLTITCFSPTKTFNLAGLQASFAVLPIKEEKNIIENKLMQLSIKRNNSFSLVAMEAAYNKGENWLDECIDYIEGNIDFVIDYAKNNIKDIHIVKPDGTYLLWLDFTKLKASHEEIKRLLLEEGKIALSNGTDFGDCGEKFFRMNVSCPRKMIKDGIKRIEKVVNMLL